MVSWGSISFATETIRKKYKSPKLNKDPVMPPYYVNLEMNIPVEEAIAARIPRSICEQQLGHSDVPLPPTTKDMEFPPIWCEKCLIAKPVFEAFGRRPFVCNDLPRRIRPEAKAAHNTKTCNTNPYNRKFNPLIKTHNCSGITIMAQKPKCETEVTKVAKTNRNKTPNR